MGAIINFNNWNVYTIYVTACVGYVRSSNVTGIEVNYSFKKHYFVIFAVREILNYAVSMGWSCACVSGGGVREG